MKRLLYVCVMALMPMLSAHAEPPSHVVLTPNLYKCFDLLRLESQPFESKDGHVRINVNDKNQMELFHDYIAVTSWLRGYFTEMNNSNSLNGLTPDVTKSTEQKEWMPWIYSYCRAHPMENIEEVAQELAKALSGSSNKDTK